MPAYPKAMLWLLIGSALFLGCPADDPDDDDDAGDDDTGDDDTGDDDTGDDDTGDDDTGDDDTGDDDTGDDDTAGPDADADGYPEDVDCDEADPAVNPGATELCGDAVDSDCDGDPDADCVSCDVAVPGDEATIQGAIDGASAGQVICVAPGTYVENLDFVGAAVQVVGLSGPHLTVVDGGGKGRVCDFHTGEGLESRLSGFTVTGGRALKGAGIRLEDASPTLTHLVVEGNSPSAVVNSEGAGLHLDGSQAVLADLLVRDNEPAEEGGGIDIRSSTVTLRRSRIAGNRSFSGGGVRIDDSEVALVDCTIEENEGSLTGGGTRGGGIYIRQSTVTFEGSEVTGNQGYGGGGIHVDDGATVTLGGTLVHDNNAIRGGGLSVSGLGTVSGGLFSDNFAEEAGGGALLSDATGTLIGAVFDANQALLYAGGIHIEGGSPTLEQVRVTGNTSAYSGGGLACTDDAAVLRHVWIAGNEAAYGDGGGLWMEGSAATLENVAVVGNRAPGGVDGWGGGLALAGASAPTLDQVVVAGNSALHSGGIHLDDSAPVLRHVVVSDNVGDNGGGVAGVNNPQPDLQYCNVFGNAPSDFDGVTDPTGTLGNVGIDPLWTDCSSPDPLLWDLHLQLVSTLIDAGDPSVLDPDGSPADLGCFGGPGAGGQDLDQDGSPLWWQPGPYDAATYPGLGWDCDDLDPLTHAGDGC